MKNLFILLALWGPILPLCAQDYELNQFYASGPYYTTIAKSFVINEEQSEIGGFHKKVIWANYKAPMSSLNGFYLYSLDQSGLVVKTLRIPTNNPANALPAANAKRIIKTSDEGYIMIGTYFIVGKLTFATYVLKVDKDLNYQWSRTLEPNVWDNFVFTYDIIEYSSGGYVITGTQMFLGAGSDVFLLKLSDTGSTLWQQTIDLGFEDQANSIKEHSSGDMLITGWTRTEQSDSKEVLTMRVDKNGVVMWARKLDFGYEYEGEGLSIDRKQLFNEDFFLTGYVERLNFSGDFFLKEKSVLLAKIDDSGNAFWGNLYGGENTEIGHHVRTEIVGSNTEINIAGYTESFGNGMGDMLYVRTDENGGVLKSLTYGGSNWEFAYESKADRGHQSMIGQKNIPVFGSGAQINTSLVGFQLSSSSYSCGNEINIGLSRQEPVNILISAESDPNITIVNDPGSVPAVSSMNSVVECGNFFPTRLGQFEEKPVAGDFSVYPNPLTSSHAVIEYTLAQDYIGPMSLQVQNVLGETVFVPNLPLAFTAGTHSVKLDLGPLANGVYLVVMNVGSSRKVQKLVKQ